MTGISQVPHAVPAPELLEREEHLHRLAAQLAAARRGEGSVIFVSGDVGIGKTSLLRTFAQSVTAVNLLWGACEALGTSQPLGPLFDMAPKLDREVASQLFTGGNSANLFTALLAMVQRGQAPTLMLIEDVHWADQATLDLIRFLGRRARGLKLLLVVSHRTTHDLAEPKISEVLGDLVAAQPIRIELRPLSPSAVGTLASLAGHSAAEVYRITGGNPFFVTELLAGTPGAAALPRSVRDAVWARVAKLDIAAQSVIEIMSVLPSGASLELFERLCDPAQYHGVESCLACGLLIEDKAGLRFCHELARHAVLSTLSPARQRALHQRVESALAQLGNQIDTTSDPSLLGLRLHHAVLAEDAVLILRLAPLAAAHAARVGAHREAAAYLEEALKHIDQAPDEWDAQNRAAQICESWSYEAAIAKRIDDAVFAARHRAIDIWRRLGRVDKVGLNLRWLSRLHWYRGEAAEAERFADLAIGELEPVPPSAELAMCYSTRSQYHMLHNRIDASVFWGEKALALADQQGAVEVSVHALNNIGTALMAAGDMSGRPYLERSLDLALRHDFHEHAARVYTNLAEVATLNRDFRLAQEAIAGGIAFDTLHDLDAWLYYLLGCEARVFMDTGRYDRAEAHARYVLSRTDLTLIMHLTAATVLGRILARRGDPGADAILNKALCDALSTGEPQRIVPVRLALAEAAWLAGDDSSCIEHIDALLVIVPDRYHPWELAEALVWKLRAGGKPAGFDTAAAQTVWALELDQRPAEAAEAWGRLGLPFERAMALSRVHGPAAAGCVRTALDALDALEAHAAVGRVRQTAEATGIKMPPAHSRRGPYAASQKHPLNLTAREQQVLSLIAEGVSNNRMADILKRSPRTIEHHVSAILGKLGAANRMEAMLRVHREPWLVADFPQTNGTVEKDD